MCTQGDEIVAVWNGFNQDQTDTRLFTATIRSLIASEPVRESVETLSASKIELACAGGDPLLFWSGGKTPETSEVFFAP